MDVGRATHFLRDLLSELRDFADTFYPSKPVIHPTFMAGDIHSGEGPQGPTRHDNFHGLALMIFGAKSFYVADLETFQHVPETGGVGHINTISPFDDSSEASDWRIAHLEPGDVLYVPQDMWHHVVSKPRSVMANSWFFTTFAERDIQERLARGRDPIDRDATQGS